MKINTNYLEKKEVLDTILDPVSMMGLNLFKDEQTKKLQEKADLEALVQSLQNQIKETKNLIEVIDLGNKLVFKEYQKMGNENTVSIRNYFLIHLFSTSRETTSQRVWGIPR